MKPKKSRTTQDRSRTIRSDTKIGTIEKRLGLNLGVRSDMNLGTFLKQKGYPSLAGMLKNS